MSHTHTRIYIYIYIVIYIHILLYSILCYSQFGLAWPCFGRQRGSLIFHRSALHKLLNLCLSLFPEVPTASSEMDLKSGSGIKQRSLKSQAFSVPPGRIPRPPQQCLAPTSAPPPWCVLPVWRNHAHSPTIKPRNLEKLEICVRQVPVYKRERRLRVIRCMMHTISYQSYHIHFNRFNKSFQKQCEPLILDPANS